MKNENDQESLIKSSNQEYPLWGWVVDYTDYIYHHPKVPIILCGLFTLTWSYILIFVYGVFLEGNTNYYRWSGDEITSKWDAYASASKDTHSSLYGLAGKSLIMPQQFQMSQVGAIIFEKEYDNVLDVEALKEVWRFEEELHSIPGWTKFCYKFPVKMFPSAAKKTLDEILDTIQKSFTYLENDTSCFSFFSIIGDIKYFFLKNNISKNNITPDLLNQSFIDSFVTNHSGKLVSTFFGTDYDNVTKSTSRIVSIMPFGLPLDGYKNKYDRTKEQLDQLAQYERVLMDKLDEFNENGSSGIKAYSGLTFAIPFRISEIVMKQIWWLIGSFGFLFVFAFIVQKSLFSSFFGVLGVFMPIPCAATSLRLVFGIQHLDSINVIGLFLICGIGADCVFIIFELFKQSQNVYGNKNTLRLAYATQRGLISLSTSLSTSAVSFLALISSGVRIMNFFGVFCFLLLLFTFIFTFTWYLGVLSIWSTQYEVKNVNIESKLDSHSVLETYTEFENQDYPNKGVFEFMYKRPHFFINAAGLPIDNYNKYERFIYHKLTPIIYFYRLPIVLLFLIWSIVFGIYATKMPTKSEMKFLPNNHPLQKAYSLAYNGFNVPILNDFSFIYVWGLEEKTYISYSDRLTIDQYGSPVFKPFNITDPEVQLFLRKAWQIILNDTTIIDHEATLLRGCSPWESWDTVFTLDKKIEWLIPFIKPFINISRFPDDFPLTVEEYNIYNIVWQGALSMISLSEPDAYIPGTLKSNTIGFSDLDNSLKYIAIKGSMKIPKDRSVDSMRDMYNKAMKLAKKIDKESPEGFEGFHTSGTWLNMVTEEELPKQIVSDVSIAFGLSSIVILISTKNLLYTILVVYSMISTIFIILGFLYFLGWTIGTNEAIMISIASGFCADFIIQPMLSMSKDRTKRTTFGKTQASMTTFGTAVSSAFITTIAAACFLYPCDVYLFPPFATFLLGSGLFGLIHGFVVLPALINIFT